MPGIATHFVIVDGAIDRMLASPDPALQQAGALLQSNRPYAYLGAIGPALADFLPSDPPPAGVPSTGGGSPYTTTWQKMFTVAGGDGTPGQPGAAAVIGRFKHFLDKIVPIAEDEDLGALKDMNDSGEVAEIVQTAENLKTIVDNMLPVVADIGASITVGMRPRVNVGVGSPTPPAVTWTAREYLYWKHPGRFATALVQKADQSGDPRFRAYAFGYLASFAANAAGAPFVNSIVGGAYRSQWWRHRWVNNYVDAWVHGAYGIGATMAGHASTPPYAQWPSLCDAKLHTRIDLGGLDATAIMAKLRDGQPFDKVLPDDFAAYWMSAWAEAYGPPPLGSRFQAKALNGAYQMTWMKLWFQTSGEVIGCNPSPPMSPPGGCGGVPTWVDPSSTVPSDPGTGSGPPAPSVSSDPDEGMIVTGAILALLGVAATLFGGLVFGAVSIGVGVGLIIKGATQLDWAKLRCDLYWYRVYLYNGLTALHNLLTLGAFTHPYPGELALDQTTISLLGIPYTFDSGKRVVRSKPRVAGGGVLGGDHLRPFPAKLWDGSLGDWIREPNTWEQDATTAYYVAAYPSFFVDDDAANPVTGDTDVKTGGGFPFRARPGDPTHPAQLGNAVANTVDLVVNALRDLPDWNLDADRGMAALTWQFQGAVYTDPVKIEPEP